MVLKSNAKYNVPIENGTVYKSEVNDLTVSIHKIIGLDGWFLNCSKLGKESLAENKIKSIIRALKEL